MSWKVNPSFALSFLHAELLIVLERTPHMLVVPRRRELAKLLASAVHWQKGRHYTPVPLGSKVVAEMAMNRCTCASLG